MRSPRLTIISMSGRPGFVTIVMSSILMRAATSAKLALPASARISATHEHHAGIEEIDDAT